METKQMKNLIVICGLGSGNYLFTQNRIQKDSSEKDLIAVLKNNSFVANKICNNPNIIVFESPEFKDHNKHAQVIIGSGRFNENIVSEINYYYSDPSEA